MVVKGANNAARTPPPFCCISRRILDMDNLLFAIRRSLSLYFLGRTLSRGVSGMVPLNMLCAHSHGALIRSASAYSNIRRPYGLSKRCIRRPVENLKTKNLSHHVTRHRSTDCRPDASPSRICASTVGLHAIVGPSPPTVRTLPYTVGTRA